jgi:hypothetical protein
MSYGNKGEQLKMFMTPAEIHAKYQPLDADRQDSYNEEGRTGESTMRPRTTGGGMNSSRYEAGKVHEYNGAGWGDYGNRTDGISTVNVNQTAKLNKDFSRRSQTMPETSSELWERKYEEAEYDRTANINVPRTGGSSSSSNGSDSYPWVRPQRGSGSSSQPGFRKEEVSLAEAIRTEGVKSPIRLGMQFGSEGKPQIVGGHHRLAVASSDRPNDYLPVLHDTDIESARSSKNRQAGYGYT